MTFECKAVASKRWMAAASLAVLLAACGGGGDRVEDFRPTRVLAFGDENSVIESDGRKYTVNALRADNTTPDCGLNQIWSQIVAASFGITFPQCPLGVGSPSGTIYAAPNTTAADVARQVDGHLATGGFSGTDLVTVLSGQNDIVAQYLLVKAGAPEAQAAAALEAAGAALAAQVNRIANAGGKVLVSTVPDLGLTPYARSEGQTALLTRLTRSFNDKLRDNLINDGKRIGIVLANEMTQLIAENPPVYAHDNVTDPACRVPVPGCTSQTLVGTIDPGRWLWSDDRHLGPGAHSRLGELARVRATTNPF